MRESAPADRPRCAADRHASQAHRKLNCHASDETGYTSAMQWRSWRFVAVLCLGVTLILGTSISLVQAGNMAAKMSNTSTTLDSGPNDCGGCESDGGKMNAGACMAACSIMPIALSSPAAVAVTAAISNQFAWPSRLSYGRSPVPDPYPPRPFDLG